MAKGSSSATAGTRKKAAAKKAAKNGSSEPAPPPPQRGQKKKDKLKRGVPKPYTPPPKAPAPPVPDPVDKLGLASTLDAELVVVLRRLGKKDSVTRRRAVESFAEWLRKVDADADAEGWWVELVTPVWLHHLPSLLLTPSLLPCTLALHLQLLALAPDMLELGLALLLPHQQRNVLALLLATSLQQPRAALPAIELTDPSTVDMLVEYWEQAVFSPDRIWESVFPTIVSVDKNAGGGKPDKSYKGRLPVALAPTAAESPDVALEEQETLERETNLVQGALLSLTAALATLPPAEPLPETLHALLKTPQLPATLSSPQALVRKAAWGLVGVLAGRWESVGKEIIGDLGPEAGKNAWAEEDGVVRAAMAEATVVFFTKFPEVWEITDDDDDDDEADQEGDADPDAEADPKTAVDAPSKAYPTYDAFLAFLAAGCRGSAVQSYPLLALLLSTLPPSVFPLTEPSAQRLLSSVWAGFERLPTTDAPARRAFFTALLEAYTFLLSRTAAPADLCQLLGEQLERVWKECVLGAVVRAQGAGKRRVFGRPLRGAVSGADEDDALEPGEAEAKALAKWLHKVDDESLLAIAWTSIRVGTAALLDGPSTFPLPKLGGILAILGASVPPALAEAFIGHLFEVARRGVGGLMLDLDEPESDKAWIRGRMGLVGELIERKSLGDVLREDDMFTNVVDALLEGEAENVITTLPDTSAARLYRVYFSWRQDADSTKEAFHALCTVIASESLPKPVKFGAIKALLDELPLVGHVELAAKDDLGKLDGVCRGLMAELSHGTAGEESIEVLQSLMSRPRPFLSNDTLEEIIENVLTLFNATVFSFLHADWTDNELNVALLYGVLTLVESIFLRRPLEVFIQSSVARQALSSVFQSTYLVPLLLADDTETAALKKKALYLWRAIENGSGSLEDEILDLVSADIRTLVENTDSRLPSEAIMDAVPLTRYLPSSADISARLRDLTRNAIPPALAVSDPLVPQTTGGPSRAQKALTDVYGLSSVARLAAVALASVSADRTLLKKDPSWLYFLSTFSLLAADELALPGAADQVFGSSVSSADLERFVQVADGLRSYALTSLASSLDLSWHQAAVASLQKGAPSTDGLASVFASLVQDVQGANSVYPSRVLRDLLAGVLHSTGAGTSEAEKWVTYGRAMQDKAPQLALSLVLGAKDLCLDSPILQRLQNELAADLTGLKPSAVNDKGLRAIRLLAASAPPADSTAIFLPERRTVMLMQTLQDWMTGDEELDEELDSRTAEIFSHLVAIAQNDLGAHWEFVFDLLESNLEAASWEDASTLPFLAHTLRLLATVRDLAAANKVLRELWNKRKDASLAFVFDLFMSETERAPSVPLATCRDLIVDLMDELPASSITGERFSQLFSLLQDPSFAIQSTAHHLLQEVIHTRTTDLVVKAAMETEESTLDLSLPTELLNLVRTVVDVGDEDVHPTQAFGTLLAWDLLFEFFEDASLKLKTSYIEQLRNEDLISASFLPSIFKVLGVTGARGRPFELAPWAVDEFMLELYDTDAPAALSLFAAYLYYHALLRVPSLIRTWWLELKDRQLSLAVQTYTSRNLAPYVISHELSTLRDPAALAELQDDSLTVKILPAVNEVTASYIVDEQTMEIAVRLPAEYPLKPVEVKDVKRVGVDDRKWKAWLLAVQQVVTNRDGLVLDALTLFKRNVSLHFAGVTECAICYSIISVNDRSLPNRSCKTCDNTFHASCLYKWFNTSHSSSCPLCRSLF